MAESTAPRAALQAHDNGLVVSGEISFRTVTQILSEGRVLIETLAVGKLALDLSAVTKTDSAGLALVVDWIRIARQRGSHLQIVGAPSQLVDIARVSGLEDFFAGV